MTTEALTSPTNVPVDASTLAALRRLLGEELRSAGAESLIHAVADAHVVKLSVAIRYAFAVGRKALGKKADADAATSAVRLALLAVLPNTLLRVVTAGGEVGVDGLRRLRVAEFNQDQPRDDQGQWTSGVAYLQPVTVEGEEGPVVFQTGVPVTFSYFRQGSGFSDPASTLFGQHIEPHGPYVSFFEKGATPLTKQEQGKITFSSPLVISGEGGYNEGKSGEVGPLGWKMRLSNAYGGKRGLALSHAVSRDGYDGIVTVILGTSFPYVGEIVDLRKLRAAGSKFRAAKPREKAVLRMRFDATNPAVIEWARKHSAELVTQVTDTTRERIRLAIEELQEEGDFDLAHDRILAAVGDEARADLIARHETLLAANEGQRQAWDQAVDEGLLPADAKRVWITTPDERLCPVCEPLEGETADLDGLYAGEFSGPPAHVQCRCTEGIV